MKEQPSPDIDDTSGVSDYIKLRRKFSALFEEMSDQERVEYLSSRLALDIDIIKRMLYNREFEDLLYALLIKTELPSLHVSLDLDLLGMH
jgi:hypothetical protein